MLKGCQRKMIEVRGRDKEVFETAYFVLRRESERRPLRQQDLLAEANRIINENSMPRRKRAGRFGPLAAAALWLGGFLCGVGTFWLGWAILG